MSDLPTTKPELAALRADLIQRIERQTLSTKERMELQLKLSEVNAAIKHINKIAAADAKRDADVRRALGHKEAQANEQRHVERHNGTPVVVTPTMEHAELVLVKAKQLMREVTRYPQPMPEHFSGFVDKLHDFIEAQKAVCKGHQPKLPDAEWRETWNEPKEG